ncbi:MAG: hypothetical protein JSR31_11475 [Nitrospira sp.]|nr:hypothetical protein [Nitrospira sp.]
MGHFTDTQGTSVFPLAGPHGVGNNALVSTHTSPSFRRSPQRWFEYWLISLGMSVIAYLLEKVILRSVKGDGGTHP